MAASAEELLQRTRESIQRVEARDLARYLGEDGLLIDIRPEAQRQAEGSFPDAVVIERNVLEWRLDPTGSHKIEQVTDHNRPIVIACSEGYASSFAAASVSELGYLHVADLIGGYKAWEHWVSSPHS